MPGSIRSCPAIRSVDCDDDVRSVDKDVRTVDEDVLATFTRYDPYWGGQVVIGAAIALHLLLADKVTLGPNWLLPGLEALALVALTMASPHPRMRDSLLRRRLALTLIAAVTATNCYSLIVLCHFLLKGGKADGHTLIGSGIVLWVTNVLLFGVWYWQLDSGGPTARRHKRQPPSRFPVRPDDRAQSSRREGGTPRSSTISIRRSPMRPPSAPPTRCRSPRWPRP